MSNTTRRSTRNEYGRPLSIGCRWSIANESGRSKSTESGRTLSKWALKIYGSNELIMDGAK